MTAEPVSLPPDAIGSDVLHLMMERGIGHVPIVGDGGLAGIVTQTDLTRFQAESSAEIIGDAAHAPDVAALAQVTDRIPQLLAQLVGAGNRHEVVTRLITDVADAVTRRLLKLAEAELGPPPVPYLWLACGSQGRQEQTGTSDQDNVLMLSDDATRDARPLLRRPREIRLRRARRLRLRLLSRRDDGDDPALAPAGLASGGATSAAGSKSPTRWRRCWPRSCSICARSAATARCTEGLQADTLEAASRNSIFVAHMVSNSLKHSPPLGLWRGLATVRSGEHRDRIDLKMNGVVPVVDLGRIYALRGRLTAVKRGRGSRRRARPGVISDSGGRDLIDAYDLIAQIRLEHQAEQVRRGERPDNFMAPARSASSSAATCATPSSSCGPCSRRRRRDAACYSLQRLGREESCCSN